MDIDEDVAELWGLHAGDGTLYRTSGGGLVFELRGNLDERSFYEEYVAPLLNRVYPYSWRVRNRSPGTCMGVRCCRKDFARIIRAGWFPVGKKTYTVRTPPQVWSSERLLIAFLRGYFATDGCVHLAKVNGKSVPDYPTVQLSSASHTMIREVQSALLLLGIRSHTWFSQSKRSKAPVMCLQISGRERCGRFDELIGIPNTQHRARITSQLDEQRLKSK